jgi:hypothetical protein
MLGINLLVRLGRRVLAGPLATSGLLPASYYRHLVLAAMEEEDFPGALQYLPWAAEPLLAQILVLRLRLLAGQHRRQLEALTALRQSGPSGARREACQALISQENRALKLLADYEARALGLTVAGSEIT